MRCEQEYTVRTFYFSIGSKIQHSWFRGVIVGVNHADHTQLARVTCVLNPRAGRTVGSIQRFPFNHGQEICDEQTVDRATAGE